VENPGWERFLPRDEKGVVVLDRQAAVQAAFLNSPDYQTELEDLYLSALAVTFERFRFDTQFFGGTSAFYTADGRLRGGGGSQSTLGVDNALRAERLFATGGELVVGLANSLVWQFSGPDSSNVNTLLNYSLVQPLLRAGGRAVVLERLTDAERAMLANVRQMEQFRRGFYTQVVAGRSPGPGPAPGGPGIPSISSPISAAGGFLRLLEEQVRIRNQRANVVGLRRSLQRVVAYNEAGQISRLQVEQARQALYQAQSQLLAEETANYQGRLDNYKIALGLPPEVEVCVADPLLARFDLIAPEMTATADALEETLKIIGNADQPLPGDYREGLESLRQRVLAQIEAVRQDLATLNRSLPAQRRNLSALAGRPEIAAGIVERDPYDARKLDERVAKLHSDFADAAKKVGATATQWQQLHQEAPPAAEIGAPQRDALKKVLTDAAEGVSELELIQAGARLDAASLVRVDLGPEQALRIARASRPDWMNARASLVDTWRQIEIAANALQSDLNLTLSGDINTVGNNPVNFSGSTGRLRMGVEFDAPLTRVAQRNAYRAALIAYDRARREYYGFEDRVSQVLRSELRDIRLAQLDFEIQRQAVFTAITQVDVTRATVIRPPAPGEKGGQEKGATVVRDLVDALNQLLGAQNDFLSAWVDYEIQRMNLDFDLGTMQLDDHCMWVDPGPVDERSAERLEEGPKPGPELLPPPLELSDPTSPPAGNEKP
jgi:outer membrane protein TolC